MFDSIAHYFVSKFFCTFGMAAMNVLNHLDVLIIAFNQNYLTFNYENKQIPNKMSGRIAVGREVVSCHFPRQPPCTTPSFFF
jgi:hypothetical protein